MDNIYIVRGTEQAGPFTESEIRAQLASGTLSSDTLVWWDGLPEWTALSNTPLATVATPAPAPAPSVGAIPAPISPAPVAAASVSEFAPAGPIPGAAKSSALPIVSLVTGILGLPLILCWFIGLPCQIAAIVTGHIALGQIKKDPALGGKGMALGGLICGYLGIVLLAVLLTIGLMFGSHLKDLMETIQSQQAAAAAAHNAPANP